MKISDKIHFSAERFLQGTKLALVLVHINFQNLTILNSFNSTVTKMFIHMYNSIVHINVSKKLGI